jgi:hypothetical protein
VVIPSGLLLGVIDLEYALRFLLVAYGYAIVVTLTALLIEEFSFRRYHRWQDLWSILGAAIMENVGYRQLTAWWRVQGLWSALRRHPPVWGAMTREGFDGSTPAR